MTLTATDVFPDMRVQITDDSRSSYGNGEGAHGTVVRVSGSDALVRFDNDPHGYGDLYCRLSALDPVDLGSITDLDIYRRAVVRVLIKHKKINGWCGSAESLACQMGVKDLLPVQKTVSHTIHTYATVWPGQSDAEAIRAGVAMLDDPNTRYRQTSTVGDILEQYDGEEDYRVADITTVAEFQDLMVEIAMYGARQYEVGGVHDFLVECGIDPDRLRETRTVSVTVRTDVTITVGLDDDPAEAAIAQLPEGFEFAYLTEDGGY